MMTVRAVTPTDLEQLVLLCAEHADYEKASYSPEGKAKLLQVALFEQKNLYAWAVEQNKSLVGYATATLEFSTWDAAYFLHMDCLYLKAEARGQGLGEQLLREVAKLAKEKSCVNVQWQTPDWNSKAMNFYKRIGATSKNKVRFFLSRETVAALSEKEMRHEHSTDS
jgi:ribosomal protein S18 acetylase RimI-like enzyme